MAARQTRAAKVAPQEYRDADNKAAANAESAPLDVESQESAAAQVEQIETRVSDKDEVWELGQPAPATKYRDLDTGAITTETPVRSVVVAVEGGKVTNSVLRALGRQ